MAARRLHVGVENSNIRMWGVKRERDVIEGREPAGGFRSQKLGMAFRNFLLDYCFAGK